MLEENRAGDLGTSLGTSLAVGRQREGGPVKRGLSPGLSDCGAFLSSVTSSAITLQYLKSLKGKLQFKRKTLHALFAYERHLYN